jgi:hypothetical protein
MRSRALLSIFLVLFNAGCIHKQGSSPSTWERVNVNMAALAQINNDVAKGVISLQQAGVISVQQAAPILNYQENVAKDHMAIENIFAAGSKETANQATEIQSLLEEIKNQGTVLIQSGGLGVKNPQSQQTFTQDLQAIVNLAEAVLTNYQQLKEN